MCWCHIWIKNSMSATEWMGYSCTLEEHFDIDAMLKMGNQLEKLAVQCTYLSVFLYINAAIYDAQQSMAMAFPFFNIRHEQIERNSVTWTKSNGAFPFCVFEVSDSVRTTKYHHKSDNEHNKIKKSFPNRKRATRFTMSDAFIVISASLSTTA